MLRFMSAIVEVCNHNAAENFSFQLGCPLILHTHSCVFESRMFKLLVASRSFCR